jgi:adenylate cyclase
MKTLSKIILSPWLSLLTLTLILCIRIADPSFIESIRLRYFDTLISSKPTVASDNTVIVNIDDATLEKYGQWPFPRDIYSGIIDELYKKNAGLVVFNVFMPDADRFGQDSEFASVLSTYPVVLPQAATNDNVSSDTVPFRPGVSVIGNAETSKNFTVNYANIQPNVKEINDVVAGAGIVNTFPEIDGVIRRVPMLVSARGDLYPSISLETLRVASGDPSFQVKVNELGVEAVRIPKFGKIITDSYSRVWIDWSHRPKSYSFLNLPQSFNGKIIIVGLTARGLNNPVATAIGEQFPHRLQSAVLDTLVTGTTITRPDWADSIEILAIVLLSIVSILLARWKYGFIIIGGLLFSIHPIIMYVFSNKFYLFDSTFIMLSIIAVYVHAFTVKFLTELNQKLQIKKQFGSYVSPIMVERLQKNPELIKLGGERKELSIVMTDLRGFTTLGESYGDDVEGLTSIMNDYMTAISVPVLANDGCIIKFIGDASLHVHGAPLDDANHAVNAVKTALDMINAVTNFNNLLVANGKPIIGMGAGVNTGQTLIGNIGSKDRFGYDVLGDSVSTAARLEGQTKSYGVLLIIGPETASIVKDDYFVIKLDNIAVKGKTIGLDIYTVLQPTNYNRLEFANARVLHDQMLTHYCNQAWNYADTLCMELEGSFNNELDYYYNMMRKRINEYRHANLPASWDGTFVATSK